MSLPRGGCARPGLSPITRQKHPRPPAPPPTATGRSPAPPKRHAARAAVGNDGIERSRSRQRQHVPALYSRSTVKEHPSEILFEPTLQRLVGHPGVCTQWLWRVASQPLAEVCYAYRTTPVKNSLRKRAYCPPRYTSPAGAPLPACAASTTPAFPAHQPLPPEAPTSRSPRSRCQVQPQPRPGRRRQKPRHRPARMLDRPWLSVGYRLI